MCGLGSEFRDGSGVQEFLPLRLESGDARLNSDMQVWVFSRGRCMHSGATT